MTQTTPRTFSHIGLSVPDLDAALAFYAEVLGFYVLMPPSDVTEDDSAIGVMCTDVFGPGWQRLKSRMSGGGLSQSRAPILDADGLRDESHDFGEGERVFHQKFGPGTVTAINGDRLTIEFDKAGTKTVVAGFVERG